ncbi:hypothetical protein SERLA73DRAFT_54973, partial [Serpula lacrymans var. lacrymans S7.3]
TFVGVQHPPDIPLQILAGPGSGKTKVLTTRIAYLILHHGIPPYSICAVTFTNKAANEMKERLAKLIGKARAAEVKMGTFHAICVVFLRKYANRIGLESNFTICGSEESKKMISDQLKLHKEFLSANDLMLKEGTVLSLISRAKAKGQDADKFSQSNVQKVGDTKSKSGKTTQGDGIHSVVALIYEQYERMLRLNNSLDFDDLLVYGVKLFSGYRDSAQWCRHVLVDEFQDTNIMQYELMRFLAAASGCITVVGDPDQSIYGWRSAEVENLFKMQKDFLKTVQIFLEQNYRSTGSILAASVAIISQGMSCNKLRIPKKLHTSYQLGPRPMLRSFVSEHEEAAFLAVEIKRIVALAGGMLHYGDFAVLLRFNAISRTIENALQKERIPCRILGGHKFFERSEIKDLLAYLQLVDNPQYEPAFSRAVNIPSRGIGEKALAEIIAKAGKLKMSPLAVLEKICDSKIPDLKLAVKRKAAPFVTAIRNLGKLAAQGKSPSDLIGTLLILINYENHLKRTQPDWDTRWENVQELITFASEASADRNIIMKELHEEPSERPNQTDTPLRIFLQASMLSSDDVNSDEGDNEKVTISTCHAAKGLEWPVVMIPAVEQGTFPFYRTDDVEEERRLLYVAFTRAQNLLYLSYSSKRKVAGESKTKDLSEFVSVVRDENQVSKSYIYRTGQAADVQFT